MLLDVLVQNSTKKLVTFINREPTLTGQYIRWDSFGPKKRLTNLIGNLL